MGRLTYERDLYVISIRLNKPGIWIIHILIKRGPPVPVQHNCGSPKMSKKIKSFLSCTGKHKDKQISPSRADSEARFIHIVAIQGNYGARGHNRPPSNYAETSGVRKRRTEVVTFKLNSTPLSKHYLCDQCFHKKQSCKFMASHITGKPTWHLPHTKTHSSVFGPYFLEISQLQRPI